MTATSWITARLTATQIVLMALALTIVAVATGVLVEHLTAASSSTDVIAGGRCYRC